MIYTFKDWTPQIGERSWIAPSADVIGMVELGEDCSVWFGVVIRADIHFVKIGKGTNIQDLSMIHVTHFTLPDMSDGNPTIIGNYVTIGHKVMLHGCTIGDHSLIGMNAVILDGAEIGAESIVGAGALVTMNKKFPPCSLIIGSPAKAVRQLSEEEVQGLHDHSLHYIKFKDDYLQGHLKKIT
ncbi:MAG: gamma carbonic anhydrase family protein [Candidatus Cloacimonetes bacterium]|nr:gamma carbonic anhydrase family protein [Candidatus Cloacimonadota bacterium]